MNYILSVLLDDVAVSDLSLPFSNFFAGLIARFLHRYFVEVGRSRGLVPPYLSMKTLRQLTIKLFTFVGKSFSLLIIKLL